MELTIGVALGLAGLAYKVYQEGKKHSQQVGAQNERMNGFTLQLADQKKRVSDLEKKLAEKASSEDLKRLEEKLEQGDQKIEERLQRFETKVEGKLEEVLAAFQDFAKSSIRQEEATKSQQKQIDALKAKIEKT